jgi:signal transduction histidine kinase/CheY-like chemotaxis protein
MIAGDRELPILKFPIRVEPDVVTCRQKTRIISRELGFDSQDQVRIATAVSELSRNVFQYGGTGQIEFLFAITEPQTLFIRVTDRGPGISNLDSILNGTYKSPSGMGVGLSGTKRLMDFFNIETAPERGTTVTIGKILHGGDITDSDVSSIASALVVTEASNPFEELQNQNRDLSSALEEVRTGKATLAQLNRELSETNRGVLELYAELDEKAVTLERINIELQKATEDAELASLAKSRFLSNMSHEIRTPLGVIQGFADLAMDPEVVSDVRAEYLLTIRRNAESLTKLIGEILDLSKVEAGRIEIENVRFSLPHLISDIVTALELQANGKGITLKYVFDGPYPEFVTSDSMRLRQVLINVINNAVKFTSSGGVLITAKFRKSTQDAEPSMVDFFVSDTGIGLSTEQQARLFQPFMQADNSTTRKYGGTGLGLDLSKKLAQALGGDLILEKSEVGIGSTFKISFQCGPIKPEDVSNHIKIPTSEKMVVRAQTAELDGFHVLLVEDSVDNQILFSRYLSRVGAKIDIACDGIEGLRYARENKYDVILMDVQMPNLDGYGATSVLRAEGFTTPIIALTAHALHEDREAALKNGFSDYLTKPLNSELLVKTLSALKT